MFTAGARPLLQFWIIVIKQENLLSSQNTGHILHCIIVCIYLFIHLFIYLLDYYLFIYLFIYLCIY